MCYYGLHFTDCVAGRPAVHISSYVLPYCPSSKHQRDVIAMSNTPCSVCMNGGDDDGGQSGNVLFWAEHIQCC